MNGTGLFLIGLSGFLRMRSPEATTGQTIFRLGMLGVGVVAMVAAGFCGKGREASRDPPGGV